MDATIVFVMMIVCGLLMALLPFAFFMGLSSILGAGVSDPRLLVAYILCALVFSYLSSFGAFALTQRANCGGVKNMKQIALNSGLATGIQAVVLFLVWLIPFLRNIVTGLLPPDLDSNILDAVGYSYFSLWAALFGIAVGGTLSGICPS